MNIVGWQIIINMSSAKRVANLIINFVDQTLVPILQGTTEASKALQEWDKVKKYCQEE